MEIKFSDNIAILSVIGVVLLFLYLFGLVNFLENNFLLGGIVVVWGVFFLIKDANYKQRELVECVRIKPCEERRKDF